MADKPPLLSLDEALQRLAEGARAALIRDTEQVPTMDALGGVLAADLQAGVDVPPADNSAMDGYALRCADVLAAGTVLPVSQRIAAGAVGQPLAAGSAARIFTGAPVPSGADAVVMQEQCTALDDDRVRIDVPPREGLAIRRRGEDIAKGSVVLPRGTRLSPQSLGLAASIGIATLPLLRRPRVAFFSTGDELVTPGAVAPDALPLGAIFNSNRFVLRGLLQAAGCEAIDLGMVPDRLDATRAALREAAAHADLIVTCGGVSVGEEDHVKPAVAAEGRIELWQIAIKPGKPLAFGAVRRRSPGGEGGEALFLGLPGNPVSAFVTFVLAGRAVLRALQGLDASAQQSTQLPWLALRADFDWPKPDRRREFLRARINAQGGLDLYPNQGSGVLTSVAWADGLVDNPPNQAIARGDMVRLLPMAALLGT